VQRPPWHPQGDAANDGLSRHTIPETTVTGDDGVVIDVDGRRKTGRLGFIPVVAISQPGVALRQAITGEFGEAYPHAVGCS
jgi:hypothetical protein